MSVENERLKMTPHTFVTDGDGRIIIERQDGEEIIVPARFHHFFKRTQEGSSIAGIAKELRHSAEPRRFTALMRYLSFLADHGLLADRRLIRMTEAVREDYAWPESSVFGEFFALKLFSLKGGRYDATVAWIAALATIFEGSVLLLQQLNLGKSTGEEGIGSLHAVAAFFFVFCIGRSARAFAQFFAIRLSAAAPSSLRLKVDAVSMSLSSDEVSGARGGPALLLGAIGSMLWATAPATLIFLLPQSDSFQSAVVTFTWLLFLVDASPFVRSPLTDALRALYNWLDRRRESRGGKSNVLEGWMKAIHIGACSLWVAVLAFFLVGPAWDLGQRLWRGADLESRSGQMGAVLLALLLLLVAGAIVDDIMSSFSYGGGDDRRRVRRMWKRKRPQLAVDEAILQGKSPTRADLEKLPLLRQLDSGIRGELLDRARVIELGEGEKACKQGELDRTLFVLLSGRLAVAKQTRENRRRRVVALLDAGSVFGEAGFFFGRERMADVVAMEDSRLLAIRHDDAMKTMDKARSEELQLRIWFLQALVSGSFFKELPSDALDALIFAGSKKTFLAGQKMIGEGELADACYFIVQGQASVQQNMRPIAKVKAGDVIGEIALLWPGTLRTATIIADTDILCVCVEAGRFWELISSHLPLAIEIERLAEKRVIEDRKRAELAAKAS